MYVCITYVTTVYHITDSNNIAVMHQPNNHQVKVHKMKKFSPVFQSSPVNGDTLLTYKATIWLHNMCTFL